MIELECTIRDLVVRVERRMEKAGTIDQPYTFRVYDVYVDNVLMWRGLGEPFTALRTIWKET